MKLEIQLDSTLPDNSAIVHENTWNKIKEIYGNSPAFPNDHSIIVGPTFKPLYALSLVSKDLEEGVLAVSKGVKTNVYPNTAYLEI